jgi:hypothetical protein
VIEQIGVRAARIIQRVGQDREPVEGAVVVDPAGEGDNGLGPPGRIECGRAERVADDVAEEVGLNNPFLGCKLGFGANRGLFSFFKDSTVLRPELLIPR